MNPEIEDWFWAFMNHDAYTWLWKLDYR